MTTMSTLTSVEVLRNAQHPLTELVNEFITGVTPKRAYLRTLPTALTSEHIRREVRHV